MSKAEVIYLITLLIIGFVAALIALREVIEMYKGSKVERDIKMLINKIKRRK